MKLIFIFSITSLILPIFGKNETKVIGVGRYKRQSGSGCNYSFQFNQVGQSAMLKSPGHPANYPANVDCRYTITSPVGTKMNVDCTEFNLEASQNCQYDAFFISPSGDTTFQDQQFFCGQGGFSRSTQSNRLAIGFHSDDSNPQSNVPYRFQCKISVVRNNDGGSQQPSCSCGVRNSRTRIVGGQEAAPGEFPWRCALYSRYLGVFCGCSVISRNWILTAAHCTAGVQSGDQIYVNVGDHDLSSNTEIANQIVPVDYFIQNNLYNDQTQDSDIALLRLQSPLNFTRNIAPICLPWKFANENFEGRRVTASGWGSKFYGAGVTPILQKVDNLPVLGHQRCSGYYSGTSVTITNNMICTYDPPRDTCQGDSGTSIDYQDINTGRYYAIGITSLGVGCGSENHPGIYTFTPRFLNWIYGNTIGETFCRA